MVVWICLRIGYPRTPWFIIIFPIARSSLVDFAASPIFTSFLRGEIERAQRTRSSTWPYMLLVYLHLWVVSKHTPTFVGTLLMILCWIVSFGLRDLNTTCCRMRTIENIRMKCSGKNKEVFSVQYLGGSCLYTHNLYQFVHILHACVGSKKYTRSTAATKRWPINPCLRWLAVQQYNLRCPIIFCWHPSVCWLMLFDFLYIFVDKTP